MVLIAVVAADAVAGVYLLVYGVRRERWDKPRVLIVGGLLLACAAALVVIGVLSAHRDRHRAPVPPAPSSPAPGTAV